MKDKKNLQKFAAVLLTLAVWQAASMALNQKSAAGLASLRTGEACHYLARAGILSSIWFSFIRIVGGFGLALVLGVLLAVLAGKFRVLETFFGRCLRRLSPCRWRRLSLSA